VTPPGRNCDDFRHFGRHMVRIMTIRTSNPPNAASGQMDMDTNSLEEERMSITSDRPQERNGQMDSGPHPGGDLSMSTVHDGRRPRLIPVSSADLLKRAEHRLEAADKAQLWGLHIQAGAVTLVNA
jgi:hypothetical protein